jgi:hypothetical protein
LRLFLSWFLPSSDISCQHNHTGDFSVDIKVYTVTATWWHLYAYSDSTVSHTCYMMEIRLL